MNEFLLYQSGIFYGKIDFQEEIFIEKLDFTTNKLQTKAIATEKDLQFYENTFKRSLISIKELLLEEEKIVNAKQDTITLDCGNILNKNDHPTWVERNRKFPMDILIENNTIIALIFPTREICTILVKEGYEDKTILKKWKEQYPKETIYPVEKLGTFMVPMRDKINLSTDVFLPKDAKIPLSTIFVRTPYGKEMNFESYFRYVQRGYAVVIQDVRGRNYSQGLWQPCENEIEDGDDALNWIASQSWSNKNIGMLGGSYLGFVQWAAAASGNPYLKALVSIVTSGSPFVDIPRRGGAFTSGMLAWAFAVSGQMFTPEKMIRDDWADVLNIRPLQNICKEALGYEVPFLERWLNSYDYSAMWEKSNWHSKKDKIKAPALIMSGWFDDNGMGTTEALDIVKDYPEENRKVILGPWMHNANSTRDIHNVPFGNNALRYDIDLEFFNWFDKKLNNIIRNPEKQSSVEYYTTGVNQWKSATNWPIPQLNYQKMYISSNKSLSFNLQETSGSDSYNYDPKNPALHLIDMSENELGVPENYKEVEKRNDVLCYTTSLLEKELTITGDVLVNLFASSNAPDTDWIVRITDVDEDGNSIKLVDGVLSARYRNSFTTSEFMEQGQVYEFKIKTTKISHTFLKGHKIRFTITSSAKNFIFPNSNTVDGYNSIETKVATNTLHYGKDYPTSILLPIEN